MVAQSFLREIQETFFGTKLLLGALELFCKIIILTTLIPKFAVKLLQTFLMAPNDLGFFLLLCT